MYSGDLRYGLVWIFCGWKEFGLQQMVQILNGIWNPETQLFEIRHFVKNHFKFEQKLECSGF